MKKILLVPDSLYWAWANKARALKKHLENDDIKIDIVDMHNLKNYKDKIGEYHHIHLFTYLNRYVDKLEMKWDKVSTTVASHKFQNFNLKDKNSRDLLKFRKIVCVSPMLQKNVSLFLKNKGYKDRVYYHCYNGVDEQIFYPIGVKRDYPLDRERNIVVGWSGLVKPTGIDKHGYIILKKIMNMIEKSGNNKFIFKTNLKKGLKGIPFDKMNEDFYNKVDIMIHTGVSTGTPNTIYEAGSAGCMVMGTKIGCMEELITDDVNGYLFNVNMKVVWEQKSKGYNRYSTNCAKKIVKKLLYLEENRDMIEKFGNAIRDEILSKWTWKERAKDWLEVFDL